MLELLVYKFGDCDEEIEWTNLQISGFSLNKLNCFLSAKYAIDLLAVFLLEPCSNVFLFSMQTKSLQINHNMSYFRFVFFITFIEWICFFVLMRWLMVWTTLKCVYKVQFEVHVLNESRFTMIRPLIKLLTTEKLTFFYSCDIYCWCTRI